MSVWIQYSQEQRKEYIQFLQVYGALSNLFRQKEGSLIPYLDSKFQETVFARVFDSQIVDVGNTPHDVLSVIGGKRIGIGLKTWMNSKPSYQKVMQLKRYKEDIEVHKNNVSDLAFKISEIRNERIKSDYERLGLNENDNIYHYITRDVKSFVVNECTYPLIDTTNIKDCKIEASSLLWSDGLKNYKYTFADSQIWQKFDSQKKDASVLEKFEIEIIKDPFTFLLNSYAKNIGTTAKLDEDILEIYLPLYSYKSGEVEEKSGLNAWNGASKNKGSNIPRPLNEVYIPIPIDFHKKCPDFFTDDILKAIDLKKSLPKGSSDVPQIRFHLQLPNGKKMPALLTEDSFKALQSGSSTEYDATTGKPYGQSALGQWLLIDVLGLKERKLVTRDWLKKKDTDSVRLWRKKDDYSVINIDFAPFGSFEKYMNDEAIDIE